MNDLINNQDSLQDQVLFGRLPDGLVMIDAQGRIDEWNDNARKVLGWSREEVIGRFLHDLILPKHIQLEGDYNAAGLFTNPRHRNPGRI